MGEAVGKGFTAALRLGSLAVAVGVLSAMLFVPLFGGVGVVARNAADQISPVQLDQPPLPQVSKILAADGSTIATFYYENRTDVAFQQIAPAARNAIVAIEDSRFYQHGALDMKGTIRALVRNETSGSIVQGGSSLTQQYVKNVLFEAAGTQVTLAENQLQTARTKAAKAQAQTALTKARAAQTSAIAPNMARKLQELRYAVWVEEHYSKDQILTNYLNIAFFGHRTYGIEAAAQRYFDVHASQLTLTQAATLAGMVNNATEYDPTAHPIATLQRRNLVLQRMAALGYISHNDAKSAEATPLALHEHLAVGGCDGVRYAYFCTYVQDEILNDPTYGATPKDRLNLLDTGGLTITTTLDPQYQNAAQRAVSDHTSATSSKITMEAMVQPGTGKIKAIAASRKYGFGKHLSAYDYAADRAHGGGGGVQAGSTFKLFTLAAALDNGYSTSQSYPTPSSLTVSGFTNCKGRDVGSWDVHNAEKSSGKSMDLKTATWDSVNTYYAQLEQHVGLCEVAKMAAALGMRSPSGGPLSQVPSFTLGSNEIDIIHEAAAYASFGVSGKYCSPIAIASITNSSGAQLPVASAHCHQAVDPDVANQVTSILRGVLTKGTAAGNTLDGRDAAGKTGTTENLVTAVFAGYTPNLAAVLWNGDPSEPFGDPVGEYGASLAPVWVQSFNDALAGQPALNFPGE
jgi:membrane peptidoglycan carboxypeptidase